MKKDYMESEGSLGENEVSKIKSLIGQLEPLAEKEGCSVADLVEKYSGGEDAEMEDEGDGKLSLIVARLKAKNKPSEEYEG